VKPNRAIVIHTIKQVIRWWPLFSEGYAYNSKVLGRVEPTEDFLKILLHVVDKGEEKSFIAVLVSGTGDPYGFIVCSESSDRRLSIVELFSNKKCPSTTLELVSEAQAWGRSQGFKTLTIKSTRFSHSASRFFKKQLGFDSEAIILSKKI